MWNLYRENTDVWVLGSVDGYRAFIELLESRANGVEGHTRLLSETGSAGMDVLLLPTCHDATRPFLNLQDRLVYQNGRFNMELMIGGCRIGFEFLRDQFAELLARKTGDPDDHQHVDDNAPLLIQPSVFLNIRRPVAAWTEQAMGSIMWERFVIKNDERLPSDVSYPSPESWDYELPEYDDLHARLPRATACGTGEIEDHKS